MQDSDHKEAIKIVEYRTEPIREDVFTDRTGVYVRARSSTTGKMGNFDIAELNSDSLKAWLRSRGGNNLWAENAVAIMLGHLAWTGEEPAREDDKLKAENKYLREALEYIKNNVGIGGETIKLLCEAILSERGRSELDLYELDKIKEGK